jgi:hypothetical protein
MEAEEMTLQTIGIGAVVVAAVAVAFRISPWWIFGLGSASATFVLVLSARAISAGCWGLATSLFDTATAVSLSLYAAAALGAVIDGVRLGKAGEREEAVSRCTACPLVSFVAAGVVLYAFVSVIAHCLN